MSQKRLPPLAPDWAMFLDIDGTLLEHAERPDAVRVGKPALQLLEALLRGTDGALALISGRSVADIDGLFAPLKLPAAGQHGAERRGSAGHLHHHRFLARRLQRAAVCIEEITARHCGLLLENKGSSLALHYRLAPGSAAVARVALYRVAAQLGSEFEVLEGKMVVELKPTGRDKGRAIEEFMAEPPFSGRKPIFIGDDRTDEFGFVAVNRLGGRSIKVGPGASAAHHRIADAAGVRDWLATWAARFVTDGAA